MIVKTPNELELNYLTAIILLHFFNEKIMKKYKDSRDSIDAYKLKHPANLDITMAMLHLAIISARELYEANQTDGLSDSDWLRLKGLRDSILHAKKIEDQQLRKLANTEEVFDILNKLNKHLYDKYDLNNDEIWQKHICNYYKDLSE